MPTRSRSLGRARKRRAGLLTSQQEAAEAGPSDRVFEALHEQASHASALWPDCDAWRPKSMFDVYYRLQRVVERHEWDAFASSLRRPLPITFRFTADAEHAFRQEGEARLSGWAARGSGTRRLGLVDGWQLPMNKHELREAEHGSDEAALREWLIRGTDAGLLVRQEVASMLPAAMLDVQRDHCVLDMCAAPGSKTTQLVEKVAGGAGVVVANDADPLRCYTLVKRTASLGVRAASLVVTCHGAQAMPRPPPLEEGGAGNGARNGAGNGAAAAAGGFDRIVCDVPCTGDGTTRKHPEVFHRWEVALAQRQHPLQLQIAMRGAALLKPGGLMCYSTCSLNPIENEAVVAELLRRCGGALELVPDKHPVATQLAGGCAPGMATWTVLDSGLQRHDGLSSVRRCERLSDGERRLYCASMWPPQEPAIAAQLSRCVRLIPHRSDSGGFFVALLRKLRPLPDHPAPAWPHRTRSDEGGGGAAAAAAAAAARRAGDVAAGIPSARDGNGYAPVAPAVAARLDAAIRKRASGKAARGVGPRLFARTAAAARVVYMTPACERCAAGGGAARLHVVHAGATVFRRRRGKRDAGVAAGVAKAGRFGLTAVGRRLLQEVEESRVSSRK